QKFFQKIRRNFFRGHFFKSLLHYFFCFFAAQPSSQFAVLISIAAEAVTNDVHCHFASRKTRDTVLIVFSFSFVGLTSHGGHGQVRIESRKRNDLEIVIGGQERHLGF